MNLSTLLGLQNQNSASASSGSANGTGTSSNTSQNPAGNLQTGQTVRGEVVSVKGRDIVLSLENGSQINARLDRDMQIGAGQTVTFKVKSNTGARLAMTPLYENMSHDPNVLKALTAAGMPASLPNVNMVSVLMQEGLPVNKNTLQDFSRQMALLPAADLVTLARMSRLQIPATPENIAQFEAYQNYEHQISQSILEITNGLTDTFSEMIQNKDLEGAADLLKQVLSLFTEEEIAGSGQEASPEANAGETQDIAGGTAAVAESGGAENKGAMIPTDLSEALLEAMRGKTPETAEAGQNKVPNGTQAADSEFIRDVMQDTGTQVTRNGETEPTAGQGAQNAALWEISGESRVQLADLLRNAGFSETLTSGVTQGKLSQTALLQEMAKELTGHPPNIDIQKLAQVFGSKEYNAVLKNEIFRQWLLKPEQVAGDKQVEELYRRLNEQTAKLSNALSQTVGANTPVAHSINNLSNNLNFINQLNQMFTYVQLPLKMNAGNTHGELYVYTNKKSLARKDGNVSALLHLDMEHLGPMDIYVAMRDQNVSTKFYLQEDSIIDLIAAHIHILNERLHKRGYSMNCEFIPREKEKTPMEEMLESVKNIPVLANYSFDARA